MSFFIYGKHTKERIGVWLRYTSNHDLIQLVRKSRQKRYFDTVMRVIVVEYDEKTDQVWLEVWCKNLIDSIRGKHRYNVFTIKTDVNKQWVCEGDLGKGLDEDEPIEKSIVVGKGKFFLSSSVPIINNRNLLNFMVDSQTKSFLNNQKNLTSNLLEELHRVFGTHNKCIRLEAMTKVWVLKYKDLTFNVFTAKNKGTSIEICGFTNEELRLGEKQDEIIEFLIKLHKLIN